MFDLRQILSKCYTVYTKCCIQMNIPSGACTHEHCRYVTMVTVKCKYKIVVVYDINLEPIGFPYNDF